ncbi:cupin domain-containing protein [Hahella ganghwensis]|uniref:cupin domain-containing protein n=1 Tax=Hahella ganghwensis TaxID=286420 RepID=UPI00036D0ECC|nr:cupin domain-containing protein [Hahella ganghwensis]
MSDPKIGNIFASIPRDKSSEVFEFLAGAGQVKIERIVSQGHTSPDSGWYDQDQNEWVMVVKGTAVITYDSGQDIRLQEGDYLNIPAHQKHKVSWTDPDTETLWLAVFY